MPRFIIERTFPDGLSFPTGAEGRRTAAKVGETNATEGVNWVHSYVSDDDRTHVLCVRRPQPRGRPQGGRAQRPARRPHHRGPCPRPPSVRGLSRHADLDASGATRR